MGSGNRTRAAVLATIYPDMNLNPVIDFRPRF